MEQIHLLTITGKTKYESVEQLQNAIHKALKEHKVFTKHMLYNSLGIDKHTLADWKNSSNEKYREMAKWIMNAFNIIESIIVTGALENKHNAFFAKFLLNSQFGWKENAPVNNEPVKIVLDNKSSITFDKPLTKPED